MISLAEVSPGSSQPLPESLDTLMPQALELAKLLKVNSDTMLKAPARGVFVYVAHFLASLE